MSGVTHRTANIACAALLLIPGPPLVAEDRGRPGARDGAAAPGAFAAVDAVLDRYVAEGRVAGLVGLVARDGRVVYRRAAGRRSVTRTDPLEPGDRFRIASMTKPVASVAALILVERGELGLDDAVARYIPEFGAVGVYEAADQQRRPRRPITVRDLLMHTSGLTSGSFEDTPVDALYRERLGTHDRSLAQLARDLAALPLVADRLLLGRLVQHLLLGRSGRAAGGHRSIATTAVSSGPARARFPAGGVRRAANSEPGRRFGLTPSAHEA